MTRLGATVRMVAKEGKGDELADVLSRVRAEVVKEPGCDLYKILRSRKNPDEITLVEVYRDRNALKAHQSNESLGPVSAPIGELTESMDLWLGDIVDDEG